MSTIIRTVGVQINQSFIILWIAGSSVQPHAKDRMIELNKTINWKPESPIWRTEDGTGEICIESVEELYNEIEKSVAAGFMKSNPYKDKGFVPGEYTEGNYDKIDLHRPYVDDIILVSEDGQADET